MKNFTNIESEFAKYEQNRMWREIYQDVREADDIFNLTCNYGRQPFNTRLNRYRDILPYDHTRVKLKNLEETDYINANFVECEQANRKYILAQGPLKTTCEHFWQMVWEQNTKGIIMLNKLFEKGSPKCEMYYPNVDEENCDFTLTFGKFKLNYLSEKPYQDFTIRTIECENLEQKEKRLIYHCHFTSWPDFGEPEYTGTFLNFLNECNSLQLFDIAVNGPSVIHCSAGVGRSGTFVLVDSMLELYKKFGNDLPVDALQLLKNFRTHRMGLVQTQHQLKFAFMAIIDGIKSLQDDSKSFQDYVPAEELNSIESDSDSDDDFYENDDIIIESTRPGTAKREKKRSSLSKKSKIHIDNLRKKQLENKMTIELTEPNNNILVKENSSDTNNDSSDLDKSEDEDIPFAVNRSDVQTVKVNQPRRPVEPLIIFKSDESFDEKTNNEIERESKNFLTDQIGAKSPRTSEKNQRISDKVKSMREKQIKHEKRSKLMSDLKPYIYGGAILLSGIVVHQIYRTFVTK